MSFAVKSRTHVTGTIVCALSLTLTPLAIGCSQRGQFAQFIGMAVAGEAKCFHAVARPSLRISSHNVISSISSL